MPTRPMLNTMRSPERNRRYPKEANDAYSAATSRPASARPRSQPSVPRRMQAHGTTAESAARKIPVDRTGRIHGEARNSTAASSR